MNNSGRFIRRNVVYLTAFSVAMGFLEAVVVVYLRRLYYPEGFGFPLKTLASQSFSLEYSREISTIVMLLVVSIVAGRSAHERFSYFLHCFGVWDIFYYAWLKVLLNWPQSLLTWDVLFLIPVVWAGPVLAPLVCAATMVIYSGFMLAFKSRGYRVKIPPLSWATMSAGGLLILITFVSDFAKIILREGSPGKLLSLNTDSSFQMVVSGYVPASFNWTLFIAGECLILCSLGLFIKRTKSIF